MNAHQREASRKAPLATPTGLKPDALRDLAGARNTLVADMFGLCFKIKNFHRHISGPRSAIVTCCWTYKATRSCGICGSCGHARQA
jgi:hypothetical protein